jgi:CubicO group peptidase (beta-lactamase class C family)
MSRSPLKRIFRRRAHVYDHESVTTRSSREVPAAEAGLQSTDIEAVWKAVRGLYGTGLHPAIGLCIRYDGQVVIDRTIGHQSGNSPGDYPVAVPVLATPETYFNMFSASKVVTAMLIHLLDDKGLVHLDDAVVEYIPEFGAHGKHNVTIRHVLTHRSGIPTTPKGQVDLDIISNHEAILQLICDSKPVSGAGRRLAYHALTGGYVLAEIIQRVTGKPIRQVLDEEIRKPLGFQSFNYGVAQEDLDKVAVEAFTGPRPRLPYSWLLERALGIGIQTAVDYANDPRFRTGVIPSGNLIGTPNEICQFFEMLRCEGSLNGVRIFDPRTVRRAIAEQSYLELDAILMMPVRYGMGFILGDRHVSFYGPNTAKAFGHLGFTNVLAWADPSRRISVALMNTGKPFITPELLMWLNIMRVISSRFRPL